MFTIIKSTCIKSQSHLISYATNSMIQNPKVARDNLVLQNGPGGDVYSVAMVSNDDHSSSEAHCSKHQTLSLKIKKTLVFGYSPPLPKVTSPDTVRWSSSSMSMRLAKRRQGSTSRKRWTIRNATAKGANTVKTRTSMARKLGY